MVDINLIPREYKEKRERFKVIFSKAGGIALILLILSLLFYGGLLFYQGKLQENLNNIKEEINLLNQKRDPETEKAIINLDKNLEILKELFEGHFYWSEVFTRIESLTVPEVYLSKAKLAFLPDEVSIIFSGNALTYTNIARQIVSFQEDPLVVGVKVGNISLGAEGGVTFDLSVIFSKDVLLKQW